MSLATSDTTIDVRQIAPRDRHATIFSTFERLAPGAALEIVNDHDPKPLHYQFQAERPGTFAWTYLEDGPDVWRVAIQKLAPAPAAGGCCGVCGGGR